MRCCGFSAYSDVILLLSHGSDHCLETRQGADDSHILPNYLLGKLASFNIQAVKDVRQVLKGSALPLEHEAEGLFALISKTKAEYQASLSGAPTGSSALTEKPSPKRRPIGPATATIPAGTSSPSASNAVDPIGPNASHITPAAPVPPPKRVVDVWAPCLKVDASAFERKATKSALFGSTLEPKHSPAMSSTKAVSSSKLFGSTLNSKSRSEKSSAATLTDIHDEILGEFLPSPSAVPAIPPIDTTPKSPREQKTQLPEVETVPYVPNSSRMTGQGSNIASSAKPKSPDNMAGRQESGAPTAPVKKVKKDEIVQVKKASKKRDRPTLSGSEIGEGKKVKLNSTSSLPASSSSLLASSTGAASSSSPQLGAGQSQQAPTSTLGTPRTASESTSANMTGPPASAPSPVTSVDKTTGKKAKKDKKARPAPAEIPVFSYTNEPNLLDNPVKAKKDRKDRKEKKEKGEKGGRECRSSCLPHTHYICVAIEQFCQNSLNYWSSHGYLYEAADGRSGWRGFRTKSKR